MKADEPERVQTVQIEAAVEPSRPVSYIVAKWHIRGELMLVSALTVLSLIFWILQYSFYYSIWVVEHIAVLAPDLV